MDQDLKEYILKKFGNRPFGITPIIKDQCMYCGHGESVIFVINNENDDEIDNKDSLNIYDLLREYEIKNLIINDDYDSGNNHRSNYSIYKIFCGCLSYDMNTKFIKTVDTFEEIENVLRNEYKFGNNSSLVWYNQ